MNDSSQDKQLGIMRSAAVISLGLVALAGSIAATLYRRMITPATKTAAAPAVSQLVLDELAADLARLNLPTRSEVQAMHQQLAELEAQIDQLIQHTSHSKEGDKS